MFTPFSPALRASLFAQRSWLLLFGAVAGLAVALGFWIFSPTEALLLVRHGGYFVMLFTFGLFVIHLIPLFRRANLRQAWSAGGWRTVLFILGASATLHVQEPHGFKVVNDEFVQLSTSQRMHLLREVSTIARGFQFGQSFTPMRGHVDKRPTFYPFLLSTVHDLTGYRPENAFLLNALLTPVLLGLIYLVARDVSGVGGGIAAVLLAATLPLLIQTIAGGGFEVLNLVMIVGTIYLGLRLAREPDSLNLGAFCLSGVLLAQVRYESVLYLVPVALTIVFIYWKTERVQLPGGLLVAPLLLVPYPLQFNVFGLRPELWQLDDWRGDAGVYSVSYFAENVGRALRYFFSTDHSQSNSHAVALAGVVGVAFFLLHLCRSSRAQWRENPGHVVFAFFVLTLMGQAVLMMCYFWGAFDEVSTVRLSLPTQLLFILSFAFVYPLLVTVSSRWRILSLALVAYFFAWTIPTVAQRAYAHTNLAAETANWQREYLRSRADRSFIVVDQTTPMFWMPYGVASLSFDIFAERVDEFLYHYRRRTFSDYLVVHRLETADFETGAMVPIMGGDFGGAMQLETIREIVFLPTYVVRLSRIVSIDEARLKTWSERQMNPTEAQAPTYTAAQRKQREQQLIQEWLRMLP